MAGPQPLPLPRNKGGRPRGNKTKVREPVAFLERNPERTDVQPLPEDPAALERLLAPYRLLVNPLLVGFSEGLRVMGSEPLSKNEVAGGERAFSALCAQYFPDKFTDSRFLVAIWVLGTIVPRALKWLKERQAKRSDKPRDMTTEEVKAAAEKARAEEPSPGPALVVSH